jgi:hypothetical protein
MPSQLRISSERPREDRLAESISMMYFQPRDVPVVKSPQSESIVWSSHDSANNYYITYTMNKKRILSSFHGKGQN